MLGTPTLSATTWTELPKEIQSIILSGFNYDYRNITLWRGTCLFYRNLIDVTFKEMNVWLERSTKIHSLQDRIKVLKSEIEIMEADESQKMKETHSSKKNEICDGLDFFIFPQSTPLFAKKREELYTADKEHSSLKNMCREFSSLLYSNHPILQLVGGYKNLMFMREMTLIPNKLPDRIYSPLIKGFDSEGHLSVLVNDQGASIFQLKIARWARNIICMMQFAEGCFGIRQYNNISEFSDNIFLDITRTGYLKEISLDAEQALWTETQIIEGKPIATSNFCFGLKLDLNKKNYLEGAIKRS